MTIHEKQDNIIPCDIELNNKWEHIDTPEAHVTDQINRSILPSPY